MAQPKLEDRHYSEEEYLALDAASDRPNEWWFGRAFYRDGENCRHCSLAGQLLTAICNRLREKPLHVGASLLRLRLDEPRVYAYPDIVVWGEDATWSDEEQDTLLTPLLLAEIVSPQTRQRDEVWKLEHYLRCSSLDDYLIISPDKVRIEHHARVNDSEWRHRSILRRHDTVFLAGLRLVIPLREIYSHLEVPDGTMDKEILWGEDEG